MIDLNKIVNDAMRDIEKEGFVERVVKERLEKTIGDTVDSIFRTYSDFGKELEKNIEENLNVNLDNLKLPEYNTLVLKTVQEELDKQMYIAGVEKIKENLNELLSDIKPEYTLSELVEACKGEDCKEEWEHDEGDCIALIIDGNEDGYKHIYLDVDENTSKYSCDYQLDLDKDGKVYSVKLKGKELNKDKILGGLYGLDKLLFKIYSSGAKVVMDNAMDPEYYDIYFREDY